jgi:enoyl-[acyl-carrier protein] reductase III
VSLAGKVALVTGSSRGIGRATLLELAAHGADVVVNYFRNGDMARETADVARAHGVRAIAVRAHCGKPDDVRTLLHTVEREFGGLDILVCNAASGVFRPILDVDDQAWDWTMNVSTRSVLWAAQLAAPMMEARGGGHLVTIGSSYSERVLPTYGMIGVAKGALEALTRYLAVELAPRNIIVNSVAPGAIDTDAWRLYQNTTSSAIEAETLERTPTRALVTAADVARAVLFLCSAGGVVGHTLVVDNGRSLSG